MFRISKELDITIDNISLIKYPINEVIFFDIETTGFSPETSILYMIGCIYYQQNHFICSQWFSDTMEAQKDIIIAFMEFIKNFKVLVCYNGQGFDIPYLTKKCTIYNLPYDFNNIECIDIYKYIAPYKSLFKTDNLKQKTMESFIGLSREDQYSGGELIAFYEKYLLNHSNDILDILVLHNHDDLVGMTKLISLLAYPMVFNEKLNLKKLEEINNPSYDQFPNKEIHFQMELSNKVPKRVTCGNNTFYLTLYENIAELSVKAYTRELKYFYPNYKDYYYLPIEDTAIHKSIAFYVDKNFKTRAKAANCYSKKTGCFLPQYNEIICPYFKIDYYDKETYFEFTDEFKSDNTAIANYFLHVVNHLLKQSK